MGDGISVDIELPTWIGFVWSVVVLAAVVLLVIGVRQAWRDNELSPGARWGWIALSVLVPYVGGALTWYFERRRRAAEHETDETKRQSYLTE